MPRQPSSPARASPSSHSTASQPLPARPLPATALKTRRPHRWRRLRLACSPAARSHATGGYPSHGAPRLWSLLADFEALGCAPRLLGWQRRPRPPLLLLYRRPRSAPPPSCSSPCLIRQRLRTFLREHHRFPAASAICYRMQGILGIKTKGKGFYSNGGLMGDSQRTLRAMHAAKGRICGQHTRLPPEMKVR